MKIQLALAALVFCAAPSAFAQNRGNFNGQGQNRGGQNNGTLPLPKGVNRVVSIDAYNTVIAESQTDLGERVYTPIIIRHVYSGGIAALFGGTSIPTAQFVSPGAMNSNNGGGNGGNRGNRVAGSIGGNNGFNGGGNNGFNGNGFNGASGFNGTGFNNGFNGAGNGQIFQTPDGGVGFGQTSIVGPGGQQIPLANGPFFGQ